MNAKEKFIFIMLGALFIGAFYYYAMTEELNNRMDELNLADKNHVGVIGWHALAERENCMPGQCVGMSPLSTLTRLTGDYACRRGLLTVSARGFESPRLH